MQQNKKLYVKLGVGAAAAIGCIGLGWFLYKKLTESRTQNEDGYDGPEDLKIHKNSSYYNFPEKLETERQITKQLHDDICLIGDIGGTNCRFELYNHKTSQIIIEKYLITNDYDSMEEALTDFLEHYKLTNQYPKFGCIAIAGTIDNNCVSCSVNVNWSNINGDEVAKKMNFKFLKLLNDFEAIAYSITKVDPKNMIALNTTSPTINKQEMLCIVGPGTGMGVAFLMNYVSITGDRSFKVISSEGGSIGLPMRFDQHDPLDEDLHRFFQEKLNLDGQTHVRAELFVSGKGIPLIYQFVKQKYFEGKIENWKENEFIQNLNQKQQKVTAKHIFKAAKLSQDPVALKCIDLFIMYLALSCTQYSFTCLPIGGIVQVGNMVNFVQEIITKDLGDWEKNKFQVSFLLIKYFCSTTFQRQWLIKNY